MKDFITKKPKLSTMIKTIYLICLKLLSRSIEIQNCFSYLIR